MFSTGIFYKGALIPKKHKMPDPSFFEANLDFLCTHTEQVDFNINLPFFV